MSTREETINMGSRCFAHATVLTTAWPRARKGMYEHAEVKQRLLDALEQESREVGGSGS